jgi:hypothetical protein
VNCLRSLHMRGMTLANSGLDLMACLLRARLRRALAARTATAQPNVGLVFNGEWFSRKLRSHYHPPQFGRLAAPIPVDRGMFVLKLDGHGHLVWNRGIGDQSGEFGLGAAVAPDGGVGLVASYSFNEAHLEELERYYFSKTWAQRIRN